MQNKLHTVWIGDLESYMDELFIKRAFESLGETVISVKLYRNKGQVTASTAFAYGFVEFASQNAAREVLMRHNNKPVPGSMPVKLFKLKSTTNSLITGGSESSTYSLHVSCLSHMVDDYTLFSAFKKYPSCTFAKVIYDHATCVSRRFGFVNFSSQIEMNRAYREMQGYMLCGAPIYLNLNLNAKKVSLSDSSLTEAPPLCTTPSSTASDQYNATSQQYYNFYQQQYPGQAYPYDQSAYSQVAYGSQYDANSQYSAYQQQYAGNETSMAPAVSSISSSQSGAGSVQPAVTQPAPVPEPEKHLPEFIDGINSIDYFKDEQENAFEYLESSRWTFLDEQLKSAIQCSYF